MCMYICASVCRRVPYMSASTGRKAHAGPRCVCFQWLKKLSSPCSLSTAEANLSVGLWAPLTYMLQLPGGPSLQTAGPGEGV